MKKLMLCLLVLVCVNSVWADGPDGGTYDNAFHTVGFPVLIDKDKGMTSSLLPEVVVSVDQETGEKAEVTSSSKELPTYTYIEVKDLYESGNSPCYEVAKQDGFTDIAAEIISLCKQQFARISQEAQRYAGKLSPARSGDRREEASLVEEFERIIIVADNALSTVSHPWKTIAPIYQGDVSPDNCVISVEQLQALFDARVAQAAELGAQEMRKLASGVSLDACITALEINDDIERLAVYDKNLCPAQATVSSEDILGMTHLDDMFLNKEYHFNLPFWARLSDESKADFSKASSATSDVGYAMRTAYAYENLDESRRQLALGNAIIFNGKALVVCENNRPVMIMKPSFSGYVGCQEAKYQNLPGVGGVPNGVYMLYHNMLEEPEDKAAWGGYRIPLIPAVETNTYGRGSMYLHGTSDPDKKRSAGCISLGLSIDEFVRTSYFQNRSESLVFVVTE